MGAALVHLGLEVCEGCFCLAARMEEATFLLLARMRDRSQLLLFSPHLEAAPPFYTHL